MTEHDTFSTDPPFTFLPEDDDLSSIDDELDAAERALLADPIDLGEEPEPARVPFGRTWAFDYEAGRFIRRGRAPMEVKGEAALREWLAALVHTAAGVHASLPPEFGIQNPEDLFGDVDPTDAVATLEERLARAVSFHDRVVELEDGLEVTVDREAGAIELVDLVVITDEDDALPIRGLDAVPEV